MTEQERKEATQQGQFVESSLDKVVSISINPKTETDPGNMVITTEAGRIWMLDGDDGYQGDQTEYWYEISTPPGCLGKHP